jgi:hypothetical protein
MEVRLFDFDGTLTDNGHRRHLTSKPYLEARGRDTLVIDLWEEVVTPRSLMLPTYIVTNRSYELATETGALISAAVKILSTPSYISKSPRPAYEESRFHGGISFRNHLHTPSVQDKVCRLVTLANLHTVYSDTIAPSLVQVWDDSPEILEEFRLRWSRGSVYAPVIELHLVKYDGSRRIGVDTTRWQKRS